MISYDPDTEVKLVDYDVEAKRLENDPIERMLLNLEASVAREIARPIPRSWAFLQALYLDASAIRDANRVHEMNGAQRGRFIRVCGAITRMREEAR